MLTTEKCESIAMSVFEALHERDEPVSIEEAQELANNVALLAQDFYQQIQLAKSGGTCRKCTKPKPPSRAKSHLCARCDDEAKARRLAKKAGITAT